MALKAKTVTREMVKILALGMEEGGEAAAKALPPVYAGDAPDYSLVDCWVQVPEITKDVDTFYIFSTSYVESSFAEGAPDYARLDNPEMVYGALDEYVSNASAFEDSTNVFVPYYRQAGIRYAQESRDKTGGIDAAISGTAYDDISAALDYYFERRQSKLESPMLRVETLRARQFRNAVILCFLMDAGALKGGAVIVFSAQRMLEKCYNQNAKNSGRYSIWSRTCCWASICGAPSHTMESLPATAPPRSRVRLASSRLRHSKPAA